MTSSSAFPTVGRAWSRFKNDVSLPFYVGNKRKRSGNGLAPHPGFSRRSRAPHGRGTGFPALVGSLFQNRSQCYHENSSEDAPGKEGRERSDRWKETPAKGFRPRVSGRLLPSRLPSNEGSGRLNPPWSLQPSPDRFPDNFSPQEMEENHIILKTDWIKNDERNA